jgi:hypothetical protein
MSLRFALIAVTAAAAAATAVTAAVVTGVPDGAAAAVAARPVLTRVAASSGPIAGGRRVTVTGRNLGAAQWVFFGTSRGRALTRVSATTVQITAPAHPSGTVDVRVRTAGGITAITPADHYRFVDVPSIVAVAPSAGPAAGGTRVTLSGGNFVGVSSVHFGARAGTAIRVFSPSTLSVTAPSALARGAVDVVVTTAYGRSTAVPADRYTYAAGPRAPRATVGLARLPAGSGAGATLTVEDVACVSGTACYAVGYVRTAHGVRALIEQGSGTTWAGSFAPLPGAATGTAALYSVDCPDTTCVAVGSYTDSQGRQVPLVETLAGTTWTASAPALPAGLTTGYLARIACAAATACAAYGPGAGATLLAVLDGGQWTSRIAPVPAPYLRSLFRPSGIACGSSTSCVVVGTHVAKTAHRAVADAWNGRRWITALTPLPAGAAAAPSGLASVACLAASQCVAVGWYRPASVRTSPVARPMVATWTGVWATRSVPLPAGAITRPASAFGQLGSVSCSVNSCTAAGVYAAPAGRRGFLDILDGAASTVRAVPTAAATSQVTTACFGSTVCGVAAGVALRPHHVIVVARSGSGGLSMVRLPLARGAAQTDVRPAVVRCSRAGQCAVVGIVHSLATSRGAAQYELATFS